jgi:hypothetical protein
MAFFMTIFYGAVSQVWQLDGLLGALRNQAVVLFSWAGGSVKLGVVFFFGPSGENGGTGNW